MENQSRRLTSPFQVDDDFLDQLASIADQIAAIVRAALAKQAGLSVPEFKSFLEGQPMAAIPEWKRASMAMEVDEGLTPNYTLSMMDHSSIESSDISEIRQALRTRPAAAEQLVFTMGRYSVLRVTATFGGLAYRSARIDVKGGRQDVHFVITLLHELVVNSEPSFAILHRRATSVALALAAPPLLFFAYLAVAIVLALRFQQALPGWAWPLGVFVSVPAGTLWSQRYDKTFPLAYFSFGRAGRRRSAQRTLFFQTIGVVCIPIALACIQAALSAPNPPVGGTREPVAPQPSRGVSLDQIEKPLPVRAIVS